MTENILDKIKSINVQVKLTPRDTLDIKAKSEEISEDQWSQALDLAKKHKSEIISELKEKERRKPDLITWLKKYNAQFIYGDKVIDFSGQSENEVTDHRPKNHITKPMLRAWKTARPWILEHLPELEAKGWTRKKLFQADRFKYPMGKWGPAWSSNWLRPGVEVSILSDGAICWTWEELRGPIMQTAKPKV